MPGIDRREHDQHLTEPPHIDPSDSFIDWRVDQNEQAALLALLRCLALEGHRYKKAAEYLLWTLEAVSSVQVFDEGIDANIAEYVRISDVEAGL